MEIKNLSYIYPDGTKTFIDFNLNIKDNEITSIIGPTGSGKSTLINLIGDDITNYEGTIENNVKLSLLKDEPLESFYKKTVADELKEVLFINNYKIADSEKRINQVLLMVGLSSNILNKNPRSLNSLDRKLVSIAKSLIINPKLLVMDNPFVALTDDYKKRIIRLFKMLKNKYHKTIIIATNDTDAALSVSDSIVMLRNFEVIKKGDKYYVFKDSKFTKKHNILEPKTIEFKNIVFNKKGIKLMNRDNINDLIKDIYRETRW